MKNTPRHFKNHFEAKSLENFTYSNYGTRVKEKSVQGQRLILKGVLLNFFLGIVKTTTGLLGHSNVLVADGIDSMIDVLSSLMIWGALKYAAKPPDQDHPYGHGKAEALAAAIVALLLFVAGILITILSIHDILESAHGSSALPPKRYTLAVLIIVIFLKEALFQIMTRRARQIGSTALLADAWHHRSDVMISITAFIGITISIFGGSSYANADDWATLIACFIIFYNALAILRISFGEIMDATVSSNLQESIIQIACQVHGVRSAEKCRVRKSGLSLIADLHIRVDGDLSVHEGHAISHEVKNRLINANLALEDITLHLEPE